MPKITPQQLFSPTVLLALALMAIIVMMILPMPSWVLDVGLAASFGLAILIFTITLFIERPLDFSSFPTILLASLMLRLSLNVSSTKLIIGQGHTGTDAAGDVIQGFAQFVMGGSVFLGLVVFGVLLIVNFMVITKGAARMAEVGARFALDGMPGKQLAIDSDMSAGAIDHATARARRENDQRETTFFGSLDGASKFVKGDAVAGLLITLLNLVMGLVMGVLVHGMPVGSAFETYAILTVGDGLVSQIPSVIISIAAALLLARGGATGATDIALFEQFGKHPAALTTVAVLMVLFALVPGLPFLPFIVGGAALGFAAYRIQMKKQSAEEAEVEEQLEEAANPAPSKALGDILDLDDLHLEFAPDLVSMVLDEGTGLDARIANMRTHIATSFGLILPEIRLTDQADLEMGTYVVKVQGVEQARGTLHPDMVLALMPDNHSALPPGTDVTEPVYGAPARWIGAQNQDAAAVAGATVVTPPEILATHLLEVIKQNFSRLLTLKSLRRLLNEMTELSDAFRAEANRKLLDDLVPDKVPMDTLHSVLRLLLDERVSIRNLPLILEAIAEARVHTTQPELICEHVRQRMGFQLVAEMKREDGTIPLIQLAPEWEDTFSTYQVDIQGGGMDIALPPDMFNRLAEGLSERLNTITEQGIFAAVVTSTRRRRYLRTILKSRGITNPVLSFEEIGLEARPALVGMVQA
ncbi:flagellar biosynthesis protein FlhA [Phaeobacter gallaeciensis]|uniref:Flagellar biosynthesis protein FlhA n=2 Tax=Phaeobacter gallaeciensis TaxID=60890 RepID=A0A1B0ZT12_9RHOB|nr:MULTISPECIES: flagellar biosynthesis protein FlhA [Phaeobacter]MDF1772681.1 flagellar biosynthesis protein FlhA [Pseudophaeobacter sp. bin_em_oilr2.035]MEC9310485.1 flagellar biosynthesis protein FlhA [Pseudomonadota bacterium]ANP37286.1 flagellar biosynthesis protein FlhA [Phaeobacter gallaeciensis]MDE4063270.1 flagellar biosynthesis protein FlhA [Phaeobacter gallaeciensis]MDE4099319.1 flagellar biosynthesis protein FlhA [Phaeobacter gallaeciensis]